MAGAGLAAESAPDPVVDAAERLFGVRYLFPQQRYIISNTLEGRDQIAVLPTGSGKSLCFQLPAELLPGITLVLVPILSLLADQVRGLEERGIPVGVLRGGQAKAERERLASRLRSGELRIVYATPEVMLTHGARRLLEGLRIANLVVDEAHCVCEWGESFRPAYLELGRLVAELQPAAVTALTATGSPEILRKVREIVYREREVLTYTANPDRPSISYEVFPVLSKEQAVERLARSATRPLIVFGRSRKSVERYARLLRRRLGEPEVRFYHAGLEREERADVERWFFASRGGILTATSAYGMGVDKADIRSVIHVDVPPSPEAYLQESGRSGRDGGSSRAILLYSPEDDRFGEALEDPLPRRRYAQMLAYARGLERCRRAVLLGYLGAAPEHCDSCDICGGSVPSRPEGEAEILAALVRQKRRFTRDQAVHFLVGAGSYSARRLGLERYAASGALRGWEPDDVEAALGELALAGKVKRIAWGPWKGRLTVPRARRVMPARGSGDGGEATPSGTRSP